MTIINFNSATRRGHVTIDTGRLVLRTAGEVAFLDTGSGRLVPATDEEIAAMRDYFGTSVDLAVKAVRALA